MSLINKSFINKYKKEGFCYGIPIFSKSETKSIRSEIEALEKKFKNGISKKELDQFFRVNGHFVIPLLANLSRTSKILDYIELLLGSNILVWSVELFIKEPGSSKIVSWHQDLTYWGMGETDKEVTAWIALSNVNIESGCMRFIPESHNKKILKHKEEILYFHLKEMRNLNKAAYFLQSLLLLVPQLNYQIVYKTEYQKREL